MLTADIIPSHTVAQWLLVHIHKFLGLFGLSGNKTASEIIYVSIIILIAVFLGWLLGTIVRLITRKVIMVRNRELGEQLVKNHVLGHCSRIIPPLFILAFIPFALQGKSLLNTIILRAALVYTVVAFTLAICVITKFAWIRFEQKRNTKNLPLRGILDTILGIVWVISIIVTVAIIVDRSPVALLTGLGAFAAVLMLVFKDSILGLMAGLQLSQNDMLRIGDWIVVPTTIANGIVIDVSLTTIKVQNWDNTIVTLPPYSLISGAFQNWRGMSSSGCRQIARAITLDNDYITVLDDARIDEITARYPILKPFVEKVRHAGATVMDPGLATVNGTLDTNAGLFRAYMCLWLLKNPHITNEAQILVRLMTPTDTGTPLQIYCYTATTAWTAYEAIQSAVFEHILATVQDFGLRVFNDSAGFDVVTVARAASAVGTQSDVTKAAPQA